MRALCKTAIQAEEIISKTGRKMTITWP